MNPGTLYIVATPIGNLGDITLRAIETLKSVDLVVCEDTRVTGNLLHRLDIKKPLKALHQHSSDKIIDEVINALKGGKNIAYVTDSGTPGISDPGTHLVTQIRNSNIEIRNKSEIQNFKLKHVCHSELDSESIYLDSCLRRNDKEEKGNNKGGGGNDTKEVGNGSNLAPNTYHLKPIVVIPIPGPSAVVAAVSVSGLVEKEFYFAGFLPKKKGRQTELKYLSTIKAPIIIYESAMRIEKTLNDINQYFGDETEVFLAREMTKMFEEYWGGNINAIISDLKNHKLKGEFVVIVKLVSAKG